MFILFTTASTNLLLDDSVSMQYLADRDINIIQVVFNTQVTIIRCKSVVWTERGANCVLLCYDKYPWPMPYLYMGDDAP